MTAMVFTELLPEARKGQPDSVVFTIMLAAGIVPALAQFSWLDAAPIQSPAFDKLFSKKKHKEKERVDCSFVFFLLRKQSKLFENNEQPNNTIIDTK